MEMKGAAVEVCRGGKRLCKGWLELPPANAKATAKSYRGYSLSDHVTMVIVDVASVTKEGDRHRRYVRGSKIHCAMSH